MAQYTQDFDEKFLTQAVGTPNRHFGAILQPYLKSRQIFMCPSAAGSVATVLGTAPGEARDGKDHIWSMPDTTPAGVADPFSGSYAMSTGINVPGGLSLGTIQKPSELVMFFDAAWPDVGSVTDLSMFNSARHFNGYSFCYADGHAKWLERSRAAANNFDLFVP